MNELDKIIKALQKSIEWHVNCELTPEQCEQIINNLVADSTASTVAISKTYSFTTTLPSGGIKWRS
jgi:hypothetical protein